jgi:hypothetical protein
LRLLLWPERCLLELWLFTNHSQQNHRSRANELTALLTCAPLKGLWTSKLYRMVTSRVDTEKNKTEPHQATAAQAGDDLADANAFIACAYAVCHDGAPTAAI